MDTTHKAIAALVALALLSIPAVLLTRTQSAATGEAPPTTKLQNPMGPGDSVETKNWCSPFPYDAMSLLVVGADNRADGTTFCTSTEANAKVFTDKRGRHFVFLEYSEGHGTNAATQILEIFRFGDGQLSAIMQMDVGWATGPHARFKYEYAVGSTEAGGLLLILNGKSDEESECCEPHEKTRIIRIDHAD